MPARTVATFDALHRLVPSIVKRLSQDRDLAVRAMANPTLAIQELGFDLAPGVAREVERRVRFSEETRNRLAAIEAKLFEAAGERFNPESGEDIERVLFSRLKLPKPKGLTSLDPPPARPLEGPRIVVKQVETGGRRGGKKAQRRFVARRVEPVLPIDPLKQLKGKHQVVDLLLQHRGITLRVPKLASRADYEALKANPRGVPIAKIVVHLPEHVEPDDGRNTRI
ncbi:MAG TPA: hypothetical protein VLM91_06465 [Candidatus Methylomirabilis sp.]|nr:hypothetical protein [Candidatus Methylomirabilis sp.]